MFINTYEKVDDVYRESVAYLNNNPLLAKELDSYFITYYQLLDLVPQTIKKTFSKELSPLEEAYFELENSYHLCNYGFYKYSLIALRNVLELGILSVCWDIESKTEFKTRELVKPDQETIFKKKIIKSLEYIENVKIFDQYIELLLQIEALYNTFSDFVNTSGYNSSFLEKHRDKVNKFNENSFDKWVELMKDVVSNVIIVHILKYPVGLQYTPVSQKFAIDVSSEGFLEPDQVDMIKDILDKSALQVLQNISDNDLEAKSWAQLINSLPDVPDDEIERQINDAKQLAANKQDWINWYKAQSNGLQELKREDREASSTKLGIISEIKNWAMENKR